MAEQALTRPRAAPLAARGPDPVPESPWILDSARNRSALDGLRALGIVLVIAFHGAFVFAKVLPRPLFDAFVESMPGVLNIVWQALGSELVFFSSGFLLSYLLLREHGRYGSIDARTFWLRRGSRIVPLFLLALAIFMIGRTFRWDRVATNLLFCARITGFFELTPRGGKNYIPVGWSLEVMVHAYLLLPFLVRLVVRARWPLTVALLIAALSVAPRYFALAAEPAAYAIPPYEIVEAGKVPQIHRDLYYLTWFRLTPFLLGLAAAVALTRHRTRIERWCDSPWRACATLGVGLGLVVTSGFLPLQDPDSFVYALFGPRAWLWFWSCQRAVLIVGIALALIVVLTARHGPPALIARLLAWPGFGPISHGIYSIYLFHFAALIPAALLMFAPAVVEGITVSPSLDRDVLLENISTSIGSASVWQYLAMVLAAVWLSVRLAGFLTRRVETPAQQWLRRRFPSPERPLLPEVAAAERAARHRLAASGCSSAHPSR